jgi:hypothetical protein
MDINDLTYTINGAVFEVNRNQKPARHRSHPGEMGGDGSGFARRALVRVCLRLKYFFKSIALIC